jgi:hypothetical protein
MNSLKRLKILTNTLNIIVALFCFVMAIMYFNAAYIGNNIVFNIIAGIIDLILSAINIWILVKSHKSTIQHTDL